MGRRHLVIERPSGQEKLSSASVRVEVSDETPIGPWMSTLVARFHSPQVDRFGSPLTYRLRSIRDGTLLPTTGRFGQLRFRSGSSFVLEVETASQDGHPRAEPMAQPRRWSRRTFLTMTGSLTLISLLGLGSGMGTELVLRARAGAMPTPSPLSVRRQTTFVQHQQPVRTVAWSPDGTVLASGGNDGLVLLWKPDGTLLHTLAFEGEVRALAFSPDGTQLVVGAAQTVSFLDGRTAMLLTEDARRHRAAVTALTWTSTPVPLLISAAEDQQAIVWDGENHQPQVVFGQHTTAIEAVSTWASVVATASLGGVVRVWNALSGQQVHGYFSETAQSQRAIAFSSTGQLALAGDDGVIRLWRDGRACARQAPSSFGIHCLERSHHLGEPHGPVRALAFSPDGTLLATGGDDGRLLLWSPRTFTPLVTLTLPVGISALAWSAQGDLAVAAGTTVTLWQCSHRA